MSRMLALIAVFTFSSPVLAQPGEPKPDEVRKFEIAKDVFMEFCWIPPGEAQLGSPKEEQDYLTKTYYDGKRPDWLDNETESKRGKFKTKGFWLGKYPVTQAEWKAVMGDNPSWFQPGGRGKEKLQADNIRDTSRFPVEEVCWDDCQKFLEKVNIHGGVAKVFGKEGKFVLPHENQWEYACRGGKGNKQAFYFGSELNGTQANCDGNYPFGTATKGQYLERPTPVGAFAAKSPHPWGLCDMSGNLWQWCENIYDNGGSDRVHRGGGWADDAGSCRSADRGWSSAGNRFVGCRVALVPSGQ